MKKLWTLHTRRNMPSSQGGEPTYTTARHPSNQRTGEGGAMPQTPAQSWDRFSRALEQVGCDQFSIAVFRKEVDSNGSANLREVSLDDVDLRVIGFTDV